jgi:hypothetical protein
MCDAKKLIFDKSCRNPLFDNRKNPPLGSAEEDGSINMNKLRRAEFPVFFKLIHYFKFGGQRLEINFGQGGRKRLTNTTAFISF